MNDPKKSTVYTTKVLNEVSCVRYSPNGNWLAFGDVKGAVKIIGWSGAENAYVVKYQNDNMLGAIV